MKKIISLFIVICFSFIMLSPVDSHAGLHVRINDHTVTYTLGIGIVIGGAYILINYQGTACRPLKYSFDKKRGILIEERYLNQLQRRVTPDGKFIIFRW